MCADSPLHSLSNSTFSHMRASEFVLNVLCYLFVVNFWQFGNVPHVPEICPMYCSFFVGFLFTSCGWLVQHSNINVNKCRVFQIASKSKTCQIRLFSTWNIRKSITECHFVTPKIVFTGVLEIGKKLIIQWFQHSEIKNVLLVSP